MSDSTPAPDPTPRRRRSFRRFFQFSLRTYLILSVLGAVGLWCAMYWLREYWPQLAGSWGPPPTEVAYPGGWKVREHQRTVTDKQTGEKKTVRQGRYELIDQHGYTRCVGWFTDDLPSGQWTYYHDNGRRALQGQCKAGLRDGVWTAWYENGYTQWEIAHADPTEMEEVATLLNPHPGQPSAVTPAQLGGGFGVPSIAAASSYVEPTLSSLREGAARTWWDNGELESRGSYHLDLREGEWTFWNRDGGKTTAGRYERGRRRGKWSEWDDSGNERTVYYADGQRIDNLAALEKKLSDALAARDRAAAIDLLSVFGAIGGDAAAQLKSAIAHEGDEEIVRHALAQAIGMHERAASLIPELKAAQQRSKGSTRLLVKIALAAVDPKQRAAQIREIAADLDEAPWEEQALIYDRLADAGPDCVPSLAALLNDKDPLVRKQAAVALVRLHETAVWTVGSLPWDISRVDHPRARLLAAVRNALRKAEKLNDPEVAGLAREALEQPIGGPGRIDSFGGNQSLMGGF